MNSHVVMPAANDFSVQEAQFLKTRSFPFHYTVFSCRHFLIVLFSLTICLSILVNNLPSPRLAGHLTNGAKVPNNNVNWAM